jgi:hypothetical protein
MARASLPDPQSGLVIGYSYLWENEFRAGIPVKSSTERCRDRSCCVSSSDCKSCEGAGARRSLSAPHE